MKLNNKGFTMVELLVAMAIMGLLIIMAFPTIRAIQTNNNKKKFEEYGKSVISAAKIYVDSYGEDLFNPKLKNEHQVLELSKLVEKDLIKDINVSNVTCLKGPSNVWIVKYGDDYSYCLHLTCRSGDSIVYEVKEGESNSSSCKGFKDKVKSVTYTYDDETPYEEEALEGDEEYRVVTPLQAGFDIEKDHKTFQYWKEDGKQNQKENTFYRPKIEDNVNLKAYATLWKYTIYLQKGVATAGTMPEYITCEYGKACNLPANQYSKPGYTFTGWTLGDTGEKFSNSENIWSKMKPKITKDGLTFYATATFRANQCTISYSQGSGTFTANQSYTQKCYYGQTCAVHAASDFGATWIWHHVRVWSNGISELSQSGVYNTQSVCPYIANGDTSANLAAVWVQNKVTVHYNMNGGALKAGKAQTCPESVGSSCKNVCHRTTNDPHCTGSATGEVKTWSKRSETAMGAGGLANFMDYDDGNLYAKKSGKSATKYYYIGSPSSSSPTVSEKVEYANGKDLVCNGFGATYCEAFKTRDIDVYLYAKWS